MSATFDLFTRWKVGKGYATDAEAARALKVHVSTITPWKLHGRNGSPAVIERMAKDLGEDAVPVILQAFAEAARDAEDKRTLGRLAKRLGAACVALLALAPWTQPASAQGDIGTAPIGTPYTLCALAHNTIQAVKAWFRAFGVPSPCNRHALHPESRSTSAPGDSTKRKFLAMWTCPQIGPAGDFAGAG